MAYCVASGPGFLVASEVKDFKDQQRIRCGAFKGTILHVSTLLGAHEIPGSGMLFMAEGSGEPNGDIVIEG